MPTRTCIITGASRGIGLATALRFGRAGWNVVATARQKDTLNQAAEQIRATGGGCESVVADVAQPDGVQRVVDAATRSFGRVDALINNAGLAVLKPIDQTTSDDLARLLAVNVQAVFLATKAAWPIMKRQRSGTIVNVSSVASVDPFPGFSIYGACKAWVNLFTQAGANEGREFGIRVMAVAPGAVETRMLRTFLPDLPAEQALDPDDVAAVIESICGNEMDYVTGQTIFVRK